MRRGRAAVGLAVGGALVALLLSRLPDAVFGATRAFLLVAASGMLLLVAAAVLLLPARRLLAAAFGLPLSTAGRTVSLPPEAELRATLSPLVVAGVCLGVVLLAGMMR